MAPRTAVGRTTAASADALARVFSSAKSRRRSKTSEEILGLTDGRWIETLKKVFHFFSEKLGRGCLLHLLHVKKKKSSHQKKLKTRGIPSLQTDFLHQKSLQLTKNSKKSRGSVFSIRPSLPPVSPGEFSQSSGATRLGQPSARSWQICFC